MSLATPPSPERAYRRLLLAYSPSYGPVEAPRSWAR